MNKVIGYGRITGTRHFPETDIEFVELDRQRGVTLRLFCDNRFVAVVISHDNNGDLVLGVVRDGSDNPEQATVLFEAMG